MIKRYLDMITAQVEKAKTWWAGNKKQVSRNVRYGIRRFDRGMDRLARNIERLILWGIILNVIVHFCPEFAERFPVIYGWFDGWLQLGEFALKGALGFIYSLFTRNVSEFWAEYNLAYNELLKQFLNWIASL